jgi:hypothetical protein
MGQSGCITFYQTTKLESPTSFLKNVARTFQTNQLLNVSRTLVEDLGYEHFLRGGCVPTEWNLTASVRSLDELYRDTRSLSFELLGSPFANRVLGAVKTTIPSKIRGEFCPGDLFITVGFHDIWENAEVDEGQVFARAFLSIRFFGYGTPYDWQAFRALVFNVPEIKAVKSELEAISGPLDQVVYWSV